ncbi:OmpA family protein [Sphingomonas pokkalii]|uniref:Flagellar motor protein MotB n=1 Tax=Sphingomonas pokkalii TaxID=2175090 RepID=A0A2U0SCA6_9SPHN|nr:OmpA family protein [Sphingomonas pokkalii]PVX29003.1 flagellar motor protein MotB [Sphingomonas pokkalii]
MRKLAVTLALATTALSTPAFARDDAWYVGVEGGAMLVEDIHFDVGASKDAVTQNNNHAGWDVGGNIGYDFGPFRAEAEVSYRRVSGDSLRSTVGLPIRNSAGAAAVYPAGSYQNTGSKTSALSFMVNGLLDFGDDNGLQGFVGGGAGVSRVKNNLFVNGTADTVADSDTVFAWQALAGVRAPISKKVDVSLKYRFFNAPDVKLVDIGGNQWKGRFRSHSLLVGLTYNFGAPEPVAEPAPPPPPPPVAEPAPPPPPPPAPEAKVCTPGPYIVFFDWNKADVTPEAASILDNAISNYADCSNTQVVLAGHADRSGSASYNVGLSQRRADSVKAYMTGKGIPSGVITTEAFGESRPRVETADGVRELQNRRVEITYGPGSGQ